MKLHLLDGSGTIEVDKAAIKSVTHYGKGSMVTVLVDGEEKQIAVYETPSRIKAA